MSRERRNSSLLVGFIWELREGMELAAVVAVTSKVIWDEAAEAVHIVRAKVCRRMITPSTHI